LFLMSPMESLYYRDDPLICIYFTVFFHRDKQNLNSDHRYIT